MQLKNNAERLQFLKDYKKWGVWREEPELGVKLYKFEFSNGTKIIATEYQCEVFDRFQEGRSYYKKATDVKYHLILSDNDKYKTKYTVGEFRNYNPAGVGRNTIVKYLTEKKPEV